MKIFKTRKRIISIFLSLALALAPTSIFAAEQTDAKQPTVTITRVNEDISKVDSTDSTDSPIYVDRSGYLEPGESISGSFNLTGWFGNDFGIIAGGTNASHSGSLRLVFLSSMYTIPCDGQARVVADETGFPSGTYSYTLTNESSERTAYVLQILSP